MAKPIRIFFLVLFNQFIFSQNDSLPHLKYKFSPEATLYGGSIIQNYPGVPTQNFLSYASFNSSFQTRGGDKWHQYYNFPKLGAEAVFAFFQSKEFGYAVGIVPNMMIKNSKNYFFKIGFGASYFNKPFNYISNPSNLYIGYKFTNMTILSFGKTFKIGKTTQLDLGISTSHCSDGHTALPNVGMNSILLNVGITTWHPKMKKVPPESGLKNKMIYTVRASLGLHQFGSTTKAVGGPTYSSYHGSFYVSKPYKNIHIVDAGIVISYYTSFHDYIVNQEVYKKNINLKSGTGVIFVGHEFVFGKFGFSTQLGIYFYNPFFIQQKKIEGTWNNFGQKVEAFNTNRLGLMYYPFKKKNSLNQIKNQLMFGMFIKANGGQADMFEYTVGYRF